MADEPDEAQEESADDTEAPSGTDTADGSHEPEDKAGNQEPEAANAVDENKAPSVVPVPDGASANQESEAPNDNGKAGTPSVEPTSEPQSPIQDPAATTVGPVAETSSAVPVPEAVNGTGNDKVQKAALAHEASNVIQQPGASLGIEENKVPNATQETDVTNVIQENEVPSAIEVRVVTSASQLNAGNKGTETSGTDSQEYEYEDPKDSNPGYENEYENEDPNDKYGMGSGTSSGSSTGSSTGTGSKGKESVSHHATHGKGGEPLGLETGNLFYETPGDEYEKEEDFDIPPSKGQQSSIIIPQMQHHKPPTGGQNAIYKGQPAYEKPYVHAQSADIDCYWNNWNWPSSLVLTFSLVIDRIARANAFFYRYGLIL